MGNGGRALRWGVLALLALLLTGCSAGAGTGRSSTHLKAVTPCRSVAFADVYGTPPPYGARRLADYPARPAVCAAYWIQQAAQRFVPQSLAVRGSTAYVVGYRWNHVLGRRPCQIAVIDLRRHRETAFVPRIQADVYGSGDTFCRHGGGAEISDAGLWVLETRRLWLLDAAKLGHGDAVLRVWRLGPWAKGSALVLRGDRIGIASYRKHRRGTLTWFRTADVLRGGVTDLLARTDGGPSTVHPVARVTVPERLQGPTAARGALWFSTSRTSCGTLRRQAGRAVDFVPGADDMQFVGRSLWVVSEAGASPYVGRREALVPMLLRLDAPTLLAGTHTCAY